MTTLSPQIGTSAYSLAEEMQAPADAPAVRPAALDEWAREELLLRKLGPKGWGRVHQFRNYYQSGWGGNGRVLSPRALDGFFRFLEAASFSAQKKNPSVFLTDRGGIELCWEDASNKSVQVEFTTNGAEYYLEASGDEGLITFDNLAELSRRLSA